MAHFDLPLDQLKTYVPDVEAPSDFDAFWSSRLEDASLHAIDVALEPAGDLITSADVLDVRFSGHGGDRIAAWLYLPHGRPTERPWWSSTSATTEAAVGRSTGSAGRAWAIRISSWTRGGQEDGVAIG